MENFKDLLIQQYPIHQYMVIIHPPDNILKRVRKIREEISVTNELQKYQLRNGFFLLAKFSQFATLEQKVLDKIKLVAMEAAPFKVHLEDYIQMGNQAVGLGLTNYNGFSAIVRMMKKDQRLFKNAQGTAIFNEQPNINIVNRLNEASHASIWKKMKTRKFHSSFIANELMVLRRKSNEKQWNIVETLTLQNLPVYSHQGSLFAA